MTDPLRVLVIGVGGTGSWLADGLAAILEFSAPGSMLILVDGDHYEDKNRERQSFIEPGNKAESKAISLQRRFPQTFVAPVPKYLVEDADGEMDSSKITTSELFASGDIIFTTVDNFSARATCFNAARELDNVDCFDGGNDEAYFGSIYHYQRRAGVDVSDHPAEYHSDFVNPPDRNPGVMSCQERAMLPSGGQLIATNMAVAAHLLARMAQLLAGTTTPTTAEIMFDLGLGVATAYDRRPEEVPVAAVQVAADQSS